MVFNHKYEESEIPFLIKVPIQFQIGQIYLNMLTKYGNPENLNLCFTLKFY